jgi:hypothetical protein
MDQLNTYFNALNGTADWETIEPIFNDTLHDDCVLVTADGDRTKS